MKVKIFFHYQLLKNKISLPILPLNKIVKYHLRDGRDFERDEEGLVQLGDFYF